MNDDDDTIPYDDTEKGYRLQPEGNIRFPAPVPI